MQASYCFAFANLQFEQFELFSFSQRRGTISTRRQSLYELFLYVPRFQLSSMTKLLITDIYCWCYMSGYNQSSSCIIHTLTSLHLTSTVTMFWSEARNPDTKSWDEDMSSRLLGSQEWPWLWLLTRESKIPASPPGKSRMCFSFQNKPVKM